MNFQRLFDLAKEKGIEDIQIYLKDAQSLDIDVFKGDLDKHQMSSTQELTITGIYQGKMGKLKTEDISETHFETWVDDIIKSASLIESQDEVFIFAGSEKYEEIDGLLNEDLEKLDVKTAMENAFALEKKISERDKRIDISTAMYRQERTRVLLENSKGLKLEKDANGAAFIAYAVAREDGDSRTHYEFVMSNDPKDFDLDQIAKTAVEKSTAQLGAKPIKSGPYEILLENDASASLLAAYVSMFSAESVQKGMSKLINKVGDTIASDLITIVDNPFRKGSPRSGSFDDEGVATRHKEMISNGKLTGYLHNLKTAKKADTESTGNGFSGSVAPTNFYIEPGKTRREDAIKGMKKGMIITDLAGTHSGTNPISADFSLQANGFYVEDGKIVKPVALITVAGNYLELLQNVTEVCDDLKFGFSFIGSPSLKIKSLVVSGE